MMKKLTKLPAPRTDRLSYVKHHQDVTRQIWLPVILVTVMVGLLAALIFVATFFQNGDVNRWASAAIIWMVLPLTALLLVMMAVAIGLVYLLHRVQEVSPRYTSMVQAYALLINEKIVVWTDRIIGPVLQIKAWLSLFSKEDK
jgi:hypothetical protein